MTFLLRQTDDREKRLTRSTGPTATAYADCGVADGIWPPTGSDLRMGSRQPVVPLLSSEIEVLRVRKRWRGYSLPANRYARGIYRS